MSSALAEYAGAGLLQIGKSVDVDVDLE